MIVQIPNSFQGLHQFIFYNHPQFVQQNYKMFKLIPEHILKKHIVSNIDSVTFVLNFKTYYFLNASELVTLQLQNLHIKRTQSMLQCQEYEKMVEHGDSLLLTYPGIPFNYQEQFTPVQNNFYKKLSILYKHQHDEHLHIEEVFMNWQWQKHKPISFN